MSNFHPDTDVEGVYDVEPLLGDGHWSRREFIQNAVLLALLVAASPALEGSAEAKTPGDLVGQPVPAVPVSLNVNGQVHALELEPRVTLLDALREYLHLTGTKKGCDMGQCGACTVLVDGRRVNSCLTLAVMNQGKAITTVEGLARGNVLHPMQRAFVENDGLQCGYCTPGQVVSAVGLLSEPCGPSDAEVREGMCGNICRCGAYPNIVRAIQQVRAAHATEGKR